MSGVREADWYTVFAKTSEPTSRAHDSITAFIVERAWDGVEVGRTDHKMGVKGVDTGELLLNDLIVAAKGSGFHSLIARIVGENEGSIRLREKCDFTLVGTEIEIGRKYGRWLDVVEYQYVVPDRN